MTVRQLGKTLATLLHAQYMKPAGFKKLGSTFLRQTDAFVEMYNIQGSSWNSGAEPWQFYLNVMIRFPDLGTLQGHPMTPTYHHAAGRSNSILPDAPSSFELTQDNLQAMADSLSSLIIAISAVLPSISQIPYERARAGLYSPLPVPATWLSI